MTLLDILRHTATTEQALEVIYTTAGNHGVMTRETVRQAFKNHHNLAVRIYEELLIDWHIEQFLAESPTRAKLIDWINAIEEFYS